MNTGIKRVFSSVEETLFLIVHFTFSYNRYLWIINKRYFTFMPVTDNIFLESQRKQEKKQIKRN